MEGAAAHVETGVGTALGDLGAAPGSAILAWLPMGTSLYLYAPGSLWPFRQ